MKTRSMPVKYPELNGSEEHLPLKNEPGDAGDSNHADSDETLDARTAKKVKASDADTQIADALRDLADDKPS